MGDHAEDRQNDDIHFRMSEVPTQMLHGMYISVVGTAVGHSALVHASHHQYVHSSTVSAPVAHRVTTRGHHRENRFSRVVRKTTRFPSFYRKNPVFTCFRAKTGFSATYWENPGFP